MEYIPPIINFTVFFQRDKRIFDIFYILLTSIFLGLFYKKAYYPTVYTFIIYIIIHKVTVAKYFFQ